MAVVGDVKRDMVSEVDGDGGPIEVLVVDDEPEIADLAKVYLERVDDAIAVTLATGAPAGLERIRERPFDVVVSDYHMPAMDGLAFLDRVADVAPSTAGIVFSSDDAPEVLRGARDAGVPYVHKRMGREQFERLAGDIWAPVGDRER